MIRHRDGQIKAAEPAVGKVEMDLLAEPALGPDAHDVTHQKHADHQFAAGSHLTILSHYRYFMAWGWRAPHEAPAEVRVPT